MQFTCRVKSLSRASRYSTHAFLISLLTAVLETANHIYPSAKNWINLCTFSPLLFFFLKKHCILGRGGWRAVMHHTPGKQENTQVPIYQTESVKVELLD